MGRIFQTITTVVIVLAVIGGIAAAYFAGAGVNVAAFFNGESRDTVISGPAIVQAIQQQAHLETVEMNISDDITIRREHGTFNRCTEEVTYLAYYTVTAGVDLQAITDGNITEQTGANGRMFTITLPTAQILHSELDADQSRIINEKSPRWQPGCSHQTSDMVIEAQRKLRRQAREAAQEQGIIVRAQENAAEVLQGILANAGIEDVQIRFVD